MAAEIDRMLSRPEASLARTSRWLMLDRSNLAAFSSAKQDVVEEWIHTPLRDIGMLQKIP
jgi:hypothetical protein